MSIFDLTSPRATDDARVFDLLAYEEAGLRLPDLSAVQARYHLSDATVASIIGVNVRTLQRRKRSGGRLSAHESSALLEAMSVLRAGESVFGDAARYVRWLERRHPGLNDRSPKSLLAFAAGRIAVRDMLGRIEWGVHG